LRLSRRRTPAPRLARGPDELAAAQRLRIRVFVDEQGVSETGELDGLDEEAFHLVAMDGGEAVATDRVRMLDGDAKLERMAVDREFRGRGLGLALIAATEEEARRLGAERVVLNAQVRARGFYERAGYAQTSEEIFLDEGIEHVRMAKEL
jgi:predicted GNAT family N-acyltransferase